MKFKYLFLGILLLVLFSSFVYAEVCLEIGEIDYDSWQYCDIDNTWKDLKSDGENCLNDYECNESSCVEGICQEAFVFEESEGILNEIWDFFMEDFECVEGQVRCDGSIYQSCGAGGMWEGEDEVPGQCGVPLPDDDDSASDDDTSSGPGGSSGCTPFWKCTNWSIYIADSNTKCGLRNFILSIIVEQL